MVGYHQHNRPGELEGEEKAMFLEDLGVSESGLDRLVKASYTLLGLISYLTRSLVAMTAFVSSSQS